MRSARRSRPATAPAIPAKVHEAARAASKQFLAFDMAAIAEQSESVISAALFGALAASGALPFPRAAYEATIRDAGLGVEASLRAFGRAYDAAVAELKSPTPAPSGSTTRKEFPELRPIGDAGFDALVERARKLPEPVHGMVAAGLARVVDFQDVAYGREYLDRVEAFADDVGKRSSRSAAAKQIARAMAYDDVIRVADLKTRDSRFARMRAEVAAKPDQIVYATEFMHPRMEEVCGTLAGRARALDRDEPARARRPAPPGRSRPAGADRHDRLVPDALSVWRACAASAAARCAIAASRRISRPGSSARARRRGATSRLRSRSSRRAGWSKATRTPTTRAKASSRA